jgi:N6-adenosine-specific RNA methylase IME4
MTEEERGYHEVANIFPLLNGQEYEDLKADIAANGLLEPIWLHQDGRIIDGRNRHRACIDTGTPPQFRTWNGRGSLVSFVVSLNLHRRHLTSSQRGAAAVEVEKALQEEIAKDASARAAQSVDSRWTKERIGEELYEALKPGRAGRAQAHNEKIEERRAGQQVYFFVDGDKIKIGVSLDPDERLKQLKTGNPGIKMVGHAPGGLPVERELHKRLADKRINGEWFLFDEETRGVVDEIIRLTNLGKAYPRNAQQEAAKIVGVSKGYVSDAKRLSVAAPDLFEQVKAGEITIPQAKRESAQRDNIALLESIETKEAKAIRGVYDVVVIDPPWPMEKIARDVAPNQVGFDYPTMTEGELYNLEIPCAENSHVWLWTTHKYLPVALRLLDAWKLKYVCTFVWHKPGGFQPFGLPQYNCEFALYARRGAPVFTDLKQLFTCFNGARGAHSEKPVEFYDMVRRVTGGRRIDMFNRKNIDGFDGWGKEAPNE